MSESKIIWAADDLTVRQLFRTTRQIGPFLYAAKIHEALDDDRSGMLITRIKDAGAPRVWTDFKLHDIPRTVGLRARKLARRGADIITVHASADAAAMQAALESGVTIYAITVLTSLSRRAAYKIFGKEREAKVIELAGIAAHVGVHGIVCAPGDLKFLRRDRTLDKLELIVPGIRLPGDDPKDQRNFDTPQAAIRAGASKIVVGSIINDAKRPDEAFARLETLILTA